jgi:hypothetical protein
VSGRNTRGRNARRKGILKDKREDTCFMRVCV